MADWLANRLNKLFGKAEGKESLGDLDLDGKVVLRGDGEPYIRSADFVMLRQFFSN